MAQSTEGEKQFDSLMKSEKYFRTDKLYKTIGPVVMRYLLVFYLERKGISLRQLLDDYLRVEVTDGRYYYIKDMKRTYCLDDYDVTSLNILLQEFHLSPLDRENLDQLKQARNKISHKPAAEIDDDKEFNDMSFLLINWARDIESRPRALDIHSRRDTSLERDIESGIRRIRKQNIVVSGSHKLKQRLTKGRKYVTDVFNPVFILGNRRALSDKILQELDIRFALNSSQVVLDFDYSTDLLEQAENGSNIYTIKTADDICDETKVANILTGTPIWIYCNGYQRHKTKTEKDPLPPSSAIEKPSSEFEKKPLPFLEWREKREKGVKKVLDEVKKKYSNTCIIIIMVFANIKEKEHTPASHIAEYVVNALNYPDGLDCLIISESESYVNILKEKFAGILKDDYLKDLFVSDMSWNSVSHEMKTIFKVNPEIDCVLPCSNGNRVTMTKKEKTKFTEIDIVSGEECLHEIENTENDSKEKMNEETQTNFYKGKSISWWNFFFEGQVLERNVFSSYCNEIFQMLKHTTKPVGQYCITHYPGAGGTTLSRHIIWRFSQFKCHLDGPAAAFRCCIVKKVTDQTVEQVKAFRIFQEQNDPKPIIVLVDDARDDQEFNGFFAELNEMPGSTRIVGIAFLVLRVKRVPTNTPEKCPHLLTAKLTDEEKEKFKQKYEQLEKEHDSKYVNSLIAFNCLKESYSDKVLHETVDRLMEGVKADEKKVLKCLSVICTYEQMRHTIPWRVFDVLMLKLNEKNPWYSSMSEAMDLLLYEDGGIAIISQPLAEAVLHYCMKAEDLQLEFMVKNLLNFVDKVIKNERGSYLTEQIKSVVGDLFKRHETSSCIDENEENIFKHKTQNKTRNKTQKTQRGKQFSILIEALHEQRRYETIDSAHKRVLVLLERCFELTDDPMVGQQLARFLYCIGKYQDAVNVIQESLKRKPNSSYLFDTYGLIFKVNMDCLIDIYGNKSETVVTDDQAAEIIRLAFIAIEKFREGQHLAVKEHPKTSKRNTSCYFNEIRTAVKLLKSFEKFECYKGGDDFLHFLNDPVYEIYESSYQHLVEICPQVKDLRQGTIFQTCLKNTLQYTRDRNFQLKYYKGNSNEDKTIQTLSKQLKIFYGDESCPDQHFTCPIDLKAMMDGMGNTESPLKARIEIAMHNLKTGNDVNLDRDLIVYLGYMVVSLSVKDITITLEKYLDLLNYSSDLIESQLGIHGARLLLEVFLYHSLFHWPSLSRVSQNICPPEQHRKYLIKWRDAYHTNHGLNTREQREQNVPKVFFLLGRGTSVGNDIISMKYIHQQIKEKVTGDDIWNHSVLKEVCESFEGMVNGDGTALYYQIEYPRHGKQKFEIGMYKHRPDLSNRKVAFFMGFNWRGPTALGVREEDEDGYLGTSSLIQLAENLPNRSPQKASNDETEKVPIGTRDAASSVAKRHVTALKFDQENIACAKPQLAPVMVMDAKESADLAKHLAESPPNYIVVVGICRAVGEKKKLCLMMLYLTNDKTSETYLYQFPEDKSSLIETGDLDKILKNYKTVWYGIESASVCLIEDYGVIVDNIWDVEVMLRYVGEDEEQKTLNLKQLESWSSKCIQYEKMSKPTELENNLQDMTDHAKLIGQVYDICERCISNHPRSTELLRKIRKEIFDVAQPGYLRDKISLLKKLKKKAEEGERKSKETQVRKQQPKGKSGKGKKQK